MARLADSERTIWELRARVKELEEQFETLRNLLHEVIQFTPTGDSLVSRHFELQRLHRRVIEELGTPTPEELGRDYVSSGYWGDVSFPASEPDTCDECARHNVGPCPHVKEQA